MKKIFVFAGCMLLMATAMQAQIKAEDSVKLIVGKLVSSLKKSDGIGYGRCFTRAPRLETLQVDASGNTLVRTESIVDIANIVNATPAGTFDEKINFDVVKVEGEFAIVWAPYTMYVNGKISHCGVNMFQLIRSRGVWAIYYQMDKRRATRCDQ